MRMILSKMRISKVHLRRLLSVLLIAICHSLWWQILSLLWGIWVSFGETLTPDLTVIALTGSSGKTTTKEMIGAILSQIAPTLITRGNLNNDLGVPMMLLELTDEHRFW